MVLLLTLSNHCYNGEVYLDDGELPNWDLLSLRGLTCKAAQKHGVAVEIMHPGNKLKWRYGIFIRAINPRHGTTPNLDIRM